MPQTSAGRNTCLPNGTIPLAFRPSFGLRLTASPASDERPPPLGACGKRMNKRCRIGVLPVLSTMRNEISRKVVVNSAGTRGEHEGYPDDDAKATDCYPSSPRLAVSGTCGTPTGGGIGNRESRGIGQLAIFTLV